MSYVEINGDALRELFESPDGEVAKDLTRRALQVHRMAANLAPVGTPESTGKKGYRGGRLHSHIAWEIGTDEQGLLAVVGTNVEYAPYVELGTYKMTARPFLLPALEAAQ